MPRSQRREIVIRGSRLGEALVRSVLGVLFRGYFRGIHVRGTDGVPAEGPVLFVANHPNSLLDPALLIHVLPRTIHFGAKHTLFETPLRPVLEALGAIPIVRSQDDPRAVRKNIDAIDAYVDLLGQGGAAAIFPEGLSQDDPQVAPLKRGAARIALEAESRADFRLQLKIVPVGLQFEPRRKFRGDAFVRFGEPFGVADMRQVFRERRAAAFRELTRKIAQALGALSLHVESMERIGFIERLTDVYLKRARATGLLGTGRRGVRGELLYRMAACCNHFAKTDPETVDQVEQALKRYERLRDAVGVDSRLLEEPSFLLGGPLAPIQAVSELVFGAPFAAFGFVTGAVPFYLTRDLSARIARRDRHMASLSFWHIIIGAVLFPLVWGVLLAGVFWLFGFKSAVVFGVLLIPAGLYARFYVRRSRKLSVHLGGRMSSWLHMDALLRVEEARRDLVERMDAIRRRYLEEVFL